MSFVPHTEAERQEMLAAIGVESIEALFRDVPERHRFPDLGLLGGLSEMEVQQRLEALAGRNDAVDPRLCFLGAGTYHHWRPATVDAVLRRGELYTAYTPYQPELSQGMLQAMFEYQTMVCRLTGMEVSNASHYDGATSLAEGVLLALDRAGQGRDRIVLSPTLDPRYRAVVETYLRGTGATIEAGDGRAWHRRSLGDLIGSDTAALVIQTPDFLGQFESTEGLAEAVHAAGALLIVVVDPVSLGLFAPPGAYGADVVVAEGQSLGIPPSFGGPHLGIFATRTEHLRRLAGRLVGETVDTEGRRGYVLTLGTREQHIRRAKATSNICTNAALSALASTVYLATLGRRGLRRIAELCYHKSHHAAAEIARLPGLEVNPQAPDRAFFKEFVVRLPRPVEEVNAVLRREFGLLGGYDLGRDFPALEGHMLIAVTEMNDRAAIDRLVAGLRRACR